MDVGIPPVPILTADPPDVSSLASRNPTKDSISARPRPRPKVSNAVKFTADAKQKVNKENADALKLDISKFFDGRDTEIDRLAKKYNKSVTHIKQLLTNESSFKNTREPSLRNALIHAKGLEMNEDREPGDRLKLADIQKLVNKDTETQNLSNSQKKILIDGLKLHRETMKSGVRASNVAAAADCRAVVDRVSTEIRNLSERTGMCALAFFTRTHIHDSTVPSWADSDDAIAFLSEVLKLEPMEFLARFEQWACARTKSGGPQENLQTMRADCTRLILNGLQTALHLKNIGMSYIKYDRDIVSKYKVKLVGWPSTIKFANPSEIGTVDDIRTLRQALKVGECKWVALTRRQQIAHEESVAAKMATGELVVKKRKLRSDKGKTRGKGTKKSGKVDRKHAQETDDSEEDEDEESDAPAPRPPKKKRKRTISAVARATKKLPPAPKSKEFVDDEEDGFNEEV